MCPPAPEHITAKIFPSFGQAPNLESVCAVVTAVAHPNYRPQLTRGSNTASSMKKETLRRLVSYKRRKAPPPCPNMLPSPQGPRQPRGNESCAAYFGADNRIITYYARIL